VTALLVAGGEALLPGGWAVSDVLIRKGRIVPAPSNVGYGGETVDGAGGTNEERRTGGAGAERAAPAVTVEGDTVTAARAETLAAGGVSASAASGPEGGRLLDARGLRVVPGFVDLQCNGGFGIDLSSEPERLWELAALLPRTGVTAWLPTVVTAAPEVRERALASLRAGPPPGVDGPWAAPLGLHLEGPLLAPERRGAHPAGLLRGVGDADVGWRDWSAEAGVALVTLAPELPGALDVVRRLVDRGVVVSAGHSSATAAEATAAVDAGVRWVTHLFNAMAPLHHREPGLVGVALADDRLRVGLIADGLHAHPTAVALAARALGDRLTLVTDAVAALGLAPGPVRLGHAEAVLHPAPPGAGPDGTGGVRLADGTLAGSDLALDRAVRNLSAYAGVTTADAVWAASTVPAGLLGLVDRGAIAPGHVADLVLLDPAGRVVATVVGGEDVPGEAAGEVVSGEAAPATVSSC
jgi:N-acetylglucosamine-6-phosphate deacetylase